MSSLPPGRELANDPIANGCYGCGPDNAVGLRLRFFDDGETVRAPLTFDERHCGWPGYANFGVVFTAMLEAVTWLLWERLGPAEPQGAFTFEPRAPVALDGETVVEARLVEGDDAMRVEVACVQGGKEAARLVVPARRATPEEAAAILPHAPAWLRDAYEQRVREASASADAA